MNIADLELGLHRRGEHQYAIELRFTQPDSDSDVRLTNDDILVTFDQEALEEHWGDPEHYGKVLSEQFFSQPAFQSAFAQARTAAAAVDAPLRVRLFVGPSAPELHSLRWETLRDPASGTFLLTDERLLFSRYLSAGDWRPVNLRPKSELRALVVIADPTDLARYGMAKVDIPAELERAKTGLATIPFKALAETGKATLNNIAAALREGVDILYLVAHGMLVKGEPIIWLEDESGNSARISGMELAQRIRELDERPRMAVLVSCQSAGDGSGGKGGALAGLGPRLSEAGIPAVIAMQGNISMTSMTSFLPAFFHELQRDGKIDRALAVARGTIRTRQDNWMPALFMRLRSGQVWYVPGFGEGKEAFEKWPAIVRSVKRGQCTPILGPNLAASVLGGADDIARSWAERYNFPLAPHEREELGQVAQYLSISQDPQFPKDELVEYLRSTLMQRFSDILDTDRRDDHIYDLLAAAGEAQRQRNQADPHVVVAAQPFPIYITAGQHNLLSEALRAVGKDPMVEFCRWNEDIADLPGIYDDNPDYRPSPEQPLVFHLFGLLDEPDSLVLTEDDYYDYLIRLSRDPELIPLAIREALADTALLFLGFRLDDRSFRVLYRSLMQQEGRGRRRKYAHIAGQISPDEDRFLSPDRTRRYMEHYFGDADISIFWGSPDDFARELQVQLLAEAANPKAGAERSPSRRR